MRILSLFLFVLGGAHATIPASLEEADYCSMTPNPKCYFNGKPLCCASLDITCPLGKPTCEIGSETHFGGDYCKQDAADWGCYRGGHPRCCFSHSFTCPRQKPTCEIQTPASRQAPEYCKYPPNKECYHNGWPACCGHDEDDWTCPLEQPSCEVGTPSGFGGSYCNQHKPDTDCYIRGGKPTCCHAANVKCPTFKPTCEKQPIVVFSGFEVPVSRTEDYCTGEPDLECFVTGYPNCCGFSVGGNPVGANCPLPRNIKPGCELGSASGWGGDYCDAGRSHRPVPDHDCYVGGKPVCCDLRDDGYKCPEYYPPCEIVDV